MTAETLTRLRAERAEAERLLAQLAGDLARFVEASRDTNADDEHDPEGATIAFERAQVDALARRTRQRLADIDDAIARLEAGGYGICDRCGRPIDPERLAVRPAARTCVACASLSRR